MDFVTKTKKGWKKTDLRIELALQALEASSKLNREEIYERLGIRPESADFITTSDKRYKANY